MVNCAIADWLITSYVYYRNSCQKFCLDQWEFLRWIQGFSIFLNLFQTIETFLRLSSYLANSYVETCLLIKTSYTYKFWISMSWCSGIEWEFKFGFAIHAGVQNKAGYYLITLPKYSKTVYKAGTKISYIHEASLFKDEIIVPGRIQEDLQLVVGDNLRCCEKQSTCTSPQFALISSRICAWSFRR